MGRSKRHTHKYHKMIKIAGVNVWACALPDCSHYMPHHMKDMIVGRNSICWTCNESFVLTADLMTNPQPICHECKTNLELGIKPSEIAAQHSVEDITSFLEVMEENRMRRKLKEEVREELLSENTESQSR